MNWKLGFFRLWVLASALWLAHVGYSASGEFLRNAPFGANYQYVIQTKEMPWQIDWKKPFYEIAYAPGDAKFPTEFAELDSKYAEEWDKHVKNGVMTKIEFPDFTFLYLPSDLTKEDQTYLSNLFWRRRWLRYWEKISYWLLMSFGPPIIALLSALALRWIYLGFVRRHPA
jgi:hypothetical protein